RDATRLVYVVRNAVRRPRESIERRTANQVAVCVSHYVDSLAQASSREVVEVGLAPDRPPELPIGIVGDAAKRITAKSGDDTIVGMPNVVVTAAAFDVTSANIDH